MCDFVYNIRSILYILYILHEFQIIVRICQYCTILLDIAHETALVLCADDITQCRGTPAHRPAGPAPDRPAQAGGSLRYASALPGAWASRRDSSLGQAVTRVTTHYDLELD